MDNKSFIERELKKAKVQLFTSSSLQQMKFLQRKIAYLQSRIKEGV